MKSKSRRILALLLIVAAIAAPIAAQAKKYPTKAVEVTCLFGPGSAADLIARKFSDLAQAYLGQALPVVNRTGGGQAIGYNYVKNQKPDGYNIIWTSNGIFTAYYQGNIDFKQEAFRHIAQVSYEPVSVAVKYDAPWKTIGEFMAYIKANPGKVRIGNSGAGTFTHLTAAALENESGSRVIHVPFGKGLAFASLLGGQIEAYHPASFRSGIPVQGQAGKDSRGDQRRTPYPAFLMSQPSRNQASPSSSSFGEDLLFPRVLLTI